jgi:hypothetical protein
MEWSWWSFMSSFDLSLSVLFLEEISWENVIWKETAICCEKYNSGETCIAILNYITVMWEYYNSIIQKTYINFILKY